MIMQKHFSAAQLRNLVVDLSHAAGVSKEDAALFAEALIDADLHGISTHGISRLAIYLKRLEKGLIDPKAQLQVDRRTGSALALDAANGLGQVQATKAVDMLGLAGSRKAKPDARIRPSGKIATSLIRSV